jgi:tetratricopeptide (TPR) repeat protein
LGDLADLHHPSLVHLGNAYINLAEYQKAFTYYNTALEIARNNAQSEMGAIFGSIGNCYLSMGEIEKAIDYYKKAKARTREQKEQKNRLLEAKWLSNLGNCYRDMGQIDLAIEHFELAYAIVQEISDQRSEQTISNQAIKQDIIVGCRQNLAYCYSLRGEIEYSIDQYGKVLAIARDNGDIKVQAVCHGNLGVCYAELAEFEQVHNHLQKALKLSRDFRLMDVTSNVLHSQAEVSVDEENYEQAIKYANEGLEIGKKLGTPRLVSENSSILALAYLYSDKLDYAQTAISEALKQNVPLDLHYILALQGVIMLRKEDLSAASQAFKEARQQALYLLDNNTRDYRALDTQCLALCGLTLCEHCNYSAEASKFYRKARAINCSPGVIKRVSDLFNQLVKADAGDLLTEIQMVLESYAASGS